MARWHRDKWERSWLRHAAEDPQSDGKENEGRGGVVSRNVIPLSVNAETKWQIVWQVTGSTN